MAVQNNTMTEEERARLARQTPGGLQRVATGVGEAALGVLSRPVTAIQDAARVGATRLLGGDPATLPGGMNRYTDLSQRATSQGMGNISGGINDVVEPIRQAGLAALGAQSVAPPTAPPTAQPQIAQQPPAQLAPIPAPVSTATTPQTAQPQPAVQATAPTPTERGNYNMANTSTVDVRGNIASNLQAPQSAGLSGLGSFGGESAGQYLQRMAAQDAQTAERQQVRRAEISDDVERIGLRNTMTQGTPQERRAARQQLETLDQRATMRTQEQGENQRQAAQGATELQRTNVAGQFGLQQEAMRGAAGMQQAELTGQYGLAGREAAASASLAVAEAKGRSGAELKSQAEAISEVRRQAIADEAEQAGDFATRDRALGISQPAAARLTQDALGNVVAVDGRPVTAQEAQAYLQALGYYKTPAQ